MGEPSTPKAIVFDLDNTLFDHHHSLRCAISAVQSRYPALARKTPDELIGKYDAALQRAYDSYIRKEISYEQADENKVKEFFAAVGLAEPGLTEIKEFRAIYKRAYREALRATPGSIETLSRLRERGYLLAILTNGRTEDQMEKADSIGVRHLVHHLITSEEAGCAKPDPRIFHLVLDRLGTSADATYMVGDSPSSDIKGALDAGMSPILYCPSARDSQLSLFVENVLVVHHISQLLEHFGI
ncbi:hypothetical protein PG984_010066 [Apiospora sp. TS-2023a]